MEAGTVKGIRSLILALIVALLMIAGTARGESTLQFARLGDFRLENGATINDLQIGFRTFGRLNKEKSNVILFPTWFAGTTEELSALNLIGPGMLADTSSYFVIAVENPGNGISTSPSTSRHQGGRAFPVLSMKDMVDIHHRLLRDHLGLDRIFAVLGISMGAMQAYQWIVSYPDFCTKAVAIVGSPQLSSYDLLLWHTELMAIETAAQAGPQGPDPMRLVAGIHTLALQTPAYIARTTPPAAFAPFAASVETSIAKHDKDNWASQIRTLMSHDIYRPFNGSAGSAAGAVKTKVFTVTSRQDHVVYPGPAHIFARLLKTEPLELTGDCGHLAFLCEEPKLRLAVLRFLKE